MSLYILIFAVLCALACLTFIAIRIIKDIKPPIGKINTLDKPCKFKYVKELIEENDGQPFSMTIDIPGTEGGHQRVDEDDVQLDLTGLSPRAKKAIVSTGAFKVSDVDMGTLGYYLKNTKGVGPKTIAEINAWSEANYGKKIID
jgi:hypothetical protein